MSDKTEKLKRALTKKKSTLLVDYKKGLSTGSTLLNLACTGRPDVGLLQGAYYFLVGDTSSGKTWLTFTMLAEASINTVYDKHRFIFDNAENGAMMDIPRFFGPSVAERLEPPAGTRDNPRSSSTVEEFYYNVDEACKGKQPFIYILDSMDALSSEEELGKFKERRDAYTNGKKNISGSYAMGKAKRNSSDMRVIYNKLKASQSILILISQTRQNIGFGSQFQPRTRSGGDALTFYAALEMWTSVKGHVKTTYKGKSWEQGTISHIRLKKNRLSGRDRTVDLPILHSVGIDDIGANIDWLVDVKHWKSSKEDSTGKIEAPEFKFEGKRETLADWIVEAGKSTELRLIVADVWKNIERAISVKRENRYGQSTEENENAPEDTGS